MDDVSTEELVRLRDRYVRAFEVLRDANSKRAIAEEQMLNAHSAFEAAGGTKELMRRSVEQGASHARSV